MIKLFLITICLFISVQARENPFFPSEGEIDIPYTSNENRTIPSLKKATLSLPSHARIIKKITVEYESLDASIQTQTIELNNAIDWHLPIFISQSYAEQTTQKEEEIPRKVAEKTNFELVGEIKKTKFLILDNCFKIITKDKILRNFLLVQPHRIVIDFKRESNMKSYIKNTGKSMFTKIRVGNHDGYYRVVIELDGYYRYNLINKKYGYLITVR